MKIKKNYATFEQAVLRIPAYPVDLKALEISNLHKLISRLSKDAFFMEALYLASPELHGEVIKIKSVLQDHNKINKIGYALLKYLLRIQSRATPFGMFSGIGLLTLDNHTRIEVQPDNYFKRQTRLDMHFLVQLSQKLGTDTNIQKQLKFYPNTGLYQIGNELRYIEYYYENNQRIHETVSIENNEYIDKILRQARSGATINQLSQILVSDEISENEAVDFVTQLIANQVIVSELEPQLTGVELLKQLIKKLPENKSPDYTGLLKSIQQKLILLDKKLTNSQTAYNELKNEIAKTGVAFNEKYLFQTDSFIRLQYNTISYSCIDRITESIDFLAFITGETTSETLKKFGQKIYQRFENQLIPLSLALDTELGIPIDTAIGSEGINPLIDDLPFPRLSNNEAQEIKLNAVQKILWQKAKEAARNNRLSINLSRSDFKEIPQNNYKFPDTFSVMIQLVREDGETKPYIVNVGNNSAGNLLARFGFLHPKLKIYLKQIAQKEARLQSDKILAEIVHLPESRVGNILLRPRFRNYEIPYLAQASVPISRQIGLTDLYIKANHDGTVKLYSNKHGKEIVPKLTNAHNYHNDALPVYHFLTLYQNQFQISNWSFQWGDVEKILDFLPRVCYKKNILHPAKWKIIRTDMETLLSKKHIETVPQTFKQWLRTKQIPQWILLPKGDNKLLLNLYNPVHLNLCLHETRNQQEFWIEEFLHTGATPVTRNHQYFTNEIILGYYKKTKTDE